MFEQNNAGFEGRKQQSDKVCELHNVANTERTASIALAEIAAVTVRNVASHLD